MSDKPILRCMHARIRTAGLWLMALGCASAAPPLASELGCRSGTRERVATREPNLEDHRCEDANGLTQGETWTTDGSHVRAVEHYRDGKPHGIARVWGDIGELWAETEYREGEPVHLRMWHNNGRLAEEWRFENAKDADIWKWDESGNLSDELYQRNGDIEGVWTKYWPDGGLRRRAEWREGKLDGGFTEWYENGSRRAEGRYEAGLKVGEWRFWSTDGTESVRAY